MIAPPSVHHGAGATIRVFIAKGFQAHDQRFAYPNSAVFSTSKNNQEV